MNLNSLALELSVRMSELNPDDKVLITAKELTVLLEILSLFQNNLQAVGMSATQAMVLREEPVMCASSLYEVMVEVLAEADKMAGDL